MSDLTTKLQQAEAQPITNVCQDMLECGVEPALVEQFATNAIANDYNRWLIDNVGRMHTQLMPDGQTYPYDAKFSGINQLVQMCHGWSLNKGFWSDMDKAEELAEGDKEAAEILARNIIMTKLGLITSEAGEGMEAWRTDAKDDKLKSVAGIKVELIDILFRTCDLLGYLDKVEANNQGETSLTPDEIFHAKYLVNAARPPKHGKLF